MRILSASIKNFRSIQEMSLGPNPGLNMLVGENSAGKSNIFLAIQKCLGAAASGGWPFSKDDLRYGESREPLAIQCQIELDSEEQDKLLMELTEELTTRDLREQAQLRLNQLGRTIEFTTEWDDPIKRSYARLGPLFIQENHASNQLRDGGSRDHWRLFLERLLASRNNLSLALQQIQEPLLSPNLRVRASRVIHEHFLGFEEFRTRPNSGGRHTSLDARTGQETSGVLFNLKNHRDRYQRLRYEQIQREFSTLLPALTFEAVEQQPGGQLDVQFLQSGSQFVIPLANVSAGVAEILSWVTNLVARERHVLVLENPEQHLHPHHQRALHRLIMGAAQRNQVFIVTHSPFFVEPTHLHGLSRVWMTSEGTKINPFASDMKERELAALTESLRDVGKREMLFARAVLLVEDETARAFISTVAPRLGSEYNLDSHSVSVTSVEGEDGFSPYIKLLRNLNVPFLCLRDKRGGSPPEDQKHFRFLDGEFEEFMIREGFKEELENSRKTVGSNHARTGRHLGQNIVLERVPKLFKDLLTEIKELAQQQAATKS